MNSAKNLKILFVTTEAEPFASSGGLGAVMHALPKALKELGQDARLMIPRYLQVDSEKWHLATEYRGLTVPTQNQKGATELICNVKRFDPNGGSAPVTTYFLENMEHYEQRANIYGYADDAVRWMLLCRGVLEFLKVADWVPDVVVCSDWHTGFLPNILRTFYQNDPRLSRIVVVHSIHNLTAQMSGKRHRFVSPEDIDDGRSLLPAFEDPQLLKMNGMRRGIIYADANNTVSQTYAREITTAEYGEGLEQVLLKKMQEGRLAGILNGLDYAIWNPEKDEFLRYPFSAKNLGERVKNKAVLQERFELPQKKDFIVIGIVARMVRQKGIDLLEPIIQPLLRDLPVQLVGVGEGETSIMEFLLNLKKLFPEQVAMRFEYSHEFAHLIYAGADAVLIPSRFEPSGLTQMEAMAYGCIPIVRKTGGLADTVEDYDPGQGAGTGFVFEKIEPLSLMTAIVRAYESFCHQKDWRALQLRAMEKDFSWRSSARQYIELFRQAIKFRADSAGRQY